MYELWRDLKRGIKNNTFENYKYMYETFVRNQIGSQFIMSIKKTDIKRYYNSLVDERHLKPATIDSIHTVLHQVFEMAVDDDYIRSNPTDNVLRELKKSHCFKTEKRRALTKPEQELFLNYLKNTPEAQYWYPIFAVMVGTGLRVGELTGLRWCDIDLEEGIIDVNHTLVYYDHRTEGSKKGCYFNVNTTKTPAGMRQVPMLEFVKEAFLMEKERQELLGLHCETTVDGYTDFIFVNRFGQPQHQATLNKAIRRIIRNCNDKQFLESENPEKDISLYINSPGGSVSAGMAIYDTMQFISSDVATICTGMAASMAAVLLVAGKEGKRSALPHSRVMIHQPMGGAQGQASDIEITAREIQKLKKELYTIIADHSHTDFDKVWADSDRDYWMTAQEAKEYGMIDEVLIKK